GADGEDVAEEARANPRGDLAEALVIAKHVADLDEEVARPGEGDYLLPPRPVVARRLVVPDVLAGVDDRRRLLEALVVPALGGNPDDRRVFEDLPGMREPSHAVVGAAGPVEGGAARGLRLEDSGQLDVGGTPKRR